MGSATHPNGPEEQPHPTFLHLPENDPCNMMMVMDPPIAPPALASPQGQRLPMDAQPVSPPVATPLAASPEDAQPVESQLSPVPPIADNDNGDMTPTEIESESEPQSSPVLPIADDNNGA